MDLALAVQFIVTGLLAASFYTLKWISSPHDWIGLFAATLAFAIVPIIMGQLGDTEPSPQEPGAVMVGTGVVLVFIVLRPPATAVQYLALGSGLMAVESFWALSRYPPVHHTHEPIVRRVRSSVGMALKIATGVSLMAAAVIAVGALGSHRGAWFLLEIVAGYFVGGVAAGALVGLLRPLSRWPLGTMLLGILAGPLVYGAISPAVQLLMVMQGKPPMSLGEQIWISVGCGVLVGPPLALSVKYDPRVPDAPAA